MMKKAFTLVELLVVVGMIAILMGAVGSSVGRARRRAMIAKATQEAKEMTNAILAYENFAPGRSLQSVANGGWASASESSLKFILGGGETEGGGKIPILYNAHLQSGGDIADPWGRPYEFMIRKAGAIASRSESGFLTAPSLPNFYRLDDEERQ